MKQGNCDHQNLNSDYALNKTHPIHRFVVCMWHRTGRFLPKTEWSLVGRTCQPESFVMFPILWCQNRNRPIRKRICWQLQPNKILISISKPKICSVTFKFLRTRVPVSTSCTVTSRLYWYSRSSKSLPNLHGERYLYSFRNLFVGNSDFITLTFRAKSEMPADKLLGNTEWISENVDTLDTTIWLRFPWL